MRGRLIYPFVAELFRLDSAATAADPDGAGPLTSGYDPDFKEPVGMGTRGDGVGEPVRIEHPAVRLPCQVEPKSFEELRMFATGNSPRSRIELVFHFRDLERLSLVEVSTGNALVGPGDRLGALYDTAGAPVHTIRTPPGLYVTEARPIGFGLNRPRPSCNLLLVTFESRQLAPMRVT